MGEGKNLSLPLDTRTPNWYNAPMKTADPAYKYAYAYGALSHCMTVVADIVDRAKRKGNQIDPNDPELKWAIDNFKIADDALHTERK